MKKLRVFITLALCAMASVAFAEDAHMSVATYNLRVPTGWDVEHGNGWDTRKQAVADLIRFHGFDIFGTQEGVVYQLDFLKDQLPGYDYIGVGREDGKDGGEHSAIFFNTNLFDVVDHGDFWLSEHPHIPAKGWDAACKRVCTWGKFRHKPTGKEFMMFNLHMDHIGVVARREGAKLIIKKIEELGGDLPAFVTGDFNVDQTSEAYQTITATGKLRDSYEIADFVYAPTGTFNSYIIDGYTTDRIDHIFVTPEVKVYKYGVLTDNYRVKRDDNDPTQVDTMGTAPAELEVLLYKARTPSDHYPVQTFVSF